MRNEVVPECMSISRQREDEDGNLLPSAPHVVHNKSIIMDETSSVGALCRVDFSEFCCFHFYSSNASLQQTSLRNS